MREERKLKLTQRELDELPSMENCPLWMGFRSNFVSSDVPLGFRFKERRPVPSGGEWYVGEVRRKQIGTYMGKPLYDEVTRYVHWYWKVTVTK